MERSLKMQVGIVGLGSIGGSLGYDLRERQCRVIGVSRKQATCNRAVELGIADKASCNFDGLKSAELVILCTPIGKLEAIARQVIPHLNPDAVLTDVGSVKGPIVDAIEPLWKNFVGGHPMAGTHQSGVEAAQQSLFVDRPYVITPTAKTQPGAIAKLDQLITLIQARRYECGPAIHDQAVARISHGPVIISAALVSTAIAQHNPEEAAVVKLAKQLASSGFRDTSRVGGGNPELGLMMAQYNKDAMVQCLQQYRRELDGAIAAIESDNWDALNQWLIKTQTARPDFVD
ncbi:MAG: prephenate/arogenate dehydrogenase [Cyanobacteria bacterium P01_C01_bin.89]